MSKRIRIVTGHYGSGKTEFSLNLAKKLKQTHEKVSIVDLDVINLYFRSREKEEELNRMGIKLYASSIRANAVDIPAVAADVVAPIQDDECQLIMDIGGNAAGARTIGRYREMLLEKGCEHYFVLNCNRPETDTLEKAVIFMEEIAFKSGIAITGLVNTSHMLKATRVEDVLRGDVLCRQVYEKTGVPVIYTVALEKIAAELEGRVQGTILPISLFMREEWML
ncbi:ATP-binding protein [Filifactor villosus]|uniref:ATP-binding protein n=1 Tax=Filifactor villosus TaxID=29374 RepID=A0ABV9QHX7_9FIRM